VLGKALLDIVQMLGQKPSPESFKLAWLVLTVKPRFTMVRNKNLINLYRLVQQINKRKLPGAIVECGVWNGGCSAVMTYASRADAHHPQRRPVWLFDSFQGLPLPSAKDGHKSHADYFAGMNRGHTDNVRRVFGILGLSLDDVHMVPGWFEDTLPVATVDHIALLHIDADWYESVKLALDTLYDRVVPGGFVVLDDYNFWEGCNRALADFLDERQLTHITLYYPNRSGVYFQKPE
jgi:O-methyltransferase